MAHDIDSSKIQVGEHHGNGTVHYPTAIQRWFLKLYLESSKIWFRLITSFLIYTHQIFHRIFAYIDIKISETDLSFIFILLLLDSFYYYYYHNVAFVNPKLSSKNHFHLSQEKKTRQQVVAHSPLWRLHHSRVLLRCTSVSTIIIPRRRWRHRGHPSSQWPGYRGWP